MKRLSLFMALCLLLLSCLAIFPAGAEGGDWKKLSYAMLAQGDGATPVALESGTTTLSDDCVILFDEEKSVVFLHENGVRIDSGYIIDTAGQYLFTVYNKATYVEGAAGNDCVVYTLKMQLNLKFYNGDQEVPYSDGAVFTFFPTIVCTNAASLKFGKKGTLLPESIPETYVMDQFGEYTLTADCIVGNGKKDEEIVSFAIKPCHVTELFSKELGKYALQVEVGSFGERGLSVLVDDETELKEGVHLVTKVGKHSFKLLSNGQAVSAGYDACSYMPSEKRSTLRIQVELPSLELDTPDQSINFALWDAAVTMDGKPVSGLVTIEKHGTHKFEVVDGNGNAISDCFSIKVGEEEAVDADCLEVTFNNPHYVYVIIVGAPAALLLIAAVFFLIKRRTIV